MAKAWLKVKIMLKNIIQSKIAKRLFWLAFWGGNLGIFVCAIFFSMDIYDVPEKVLVLFGLEYNKYGIMHDLANYSFWFGAIFSAPIVICNMSFLAHLISKKIKKRKVEYHSFTIITAICVVLIFSYTGYFSASSIIYELSKTNPILSGETYFRCDSFAVKGYGPITVTKFGVCVDNYVCNALKNIVECKDSSGGKKIMKGFSKNNFDFEYVCIDEEDHTIIYDYNRKVGIDEKGYTMVHDENAGVDYPIGCYSKNEAWFFSIKGETYFWRPYKGNGRLFKVDKETFRYLGKDQYEDKNGIIKNKRVN